MASSIPDVEQNEQRCSCPGCPSKPDDGSLLYCARGLSSMQVRTVGCICTSCPYRSFGLADGYFCAVEPEQWQHLRRPLSP
jgi:hypothetical protein